MTLGGAAPGLEYGEAPPQYRLPSGTRPGAVRLQIADLARSLAFYEHVLGLGVHEQHAGRAVLGPTAGAPILELIEHPGALHVPRGGRLGLYHAAYLLPDRAALGRFVRHVAVLGVPTGMSDHLVSEAVYLGDPDGLGIEVYADRPRETWRHHGRQLEMATEPLDVADLLTAAGDAPWTGAPVGTAVGHVHLHVGDLEAASAFYHAALGLDLTVWSYPGALFMSAGGYHHHLGVNTWASSAPAAGPGDARLLDWELVLPTAADAEEAARHVEAAGFDVERAAAGWLATDPWGTGVRMVGE